jgi:threonine dehydrogenase-like Zn-dependent dehydrogenase
MSCKAVRFHAAKDVRVDEVPIPKVKPGWVLLKPEYSGICGSDLHEYLDGPHLIPATGSPHAITGEEIPIPLGHEFSGVVQEVGDGVTNVKAGDRCCVIPTIYDGDCRNCTNGLPNCCDRFGFIGLSGWGGGMSQYTIVPAEYIQPLPKDFPLDIGALVEPLSVAWHAVESSPFKTGDNVLVLGGGPIGLSVVLALVSRGCKNIMVSETSRKRREFAKQFGAHNVIDPSSVDMVEEVKKLTKGQGADVAFDAAGVQPAVYTAIKAIRAKGTLVNIALWGDREVHLNMIDMLFGEKHYMAGMSFPFPRDILETLY